MAQNRAAAQGQAAALVAGARQHIETVSVAGALDRGLGLITSRNHDRLAVVAAEAIWVPIRDYLALSVLGATVLLTTLALMWAGSRWAARSARSAGVDTPPP